MAAERQYTANTGMVEISTANTNLDGTGTLGTVLTAASNGTKVKSVTIKAVGDTTAVGMVRFYINGGGSTRLIGEVEIPVVDQSTSDAGFEHCMELDLDLQSGYILKASTQIGDKFNIIAEGLDWTYFGNDIRPDSTQYTANIGTGLISAANSNLDGTTGSVSTIFTAGTSSTYEGSLIESIIIKGTSSSTSDGMVRLFIQNSASSSTKLFTEIPVPICSPTGTNRSFFHQIDFPGGFSLQAGYRILATTANSDSFIVTVESRDWAYPNLGAKGLLAINTTPTSGGSTTSEEILHATKIKAGLVASGDILEVYASLLVNNNANTKTFRIYTNTSNSLSGAVLVASSQVTTTVATLISRFFPVVSDTAFECHGNAASTPSQYTSLTTASANVSVASISSDFWVIISGQKTNTGDTDTVRWSMIRNTRV